MHEPELPPAGDGLLTAAAPASAAHSSADRWWSLASSPANRRLGQAGRVARSARLRCPGHQRTA
jgi:hypothetical protein